MANFHSNKWIMEKLQEHYIEALQLYSQDRIVGVFLHGSANYGLDTENSDVDTKLILTPSWEEICFNKQPISTTHVRANNEHIDAKDIRLMFATFRKQNLNFVEILFTRYKILNPLYEDLWNFLINFNEEIARYSPYAAVKTMKGIAMEKYHALQHEYPSKLEVLAKYSYDPKQLHHLLRVQEFLERYEKGEKYKDCLISKTSEELKEIKEGKYNWEEAKPLAEKTIEKVIKQADLFCENNSKEINPQVDNILDGIQEAIMKRAIQTQFEKGE